MSNKKKGILIFAALIVLIIAEIFIADHYIKKIQTDDQSASSAQETSVSAELAADYEAEFYVSEIPDDIFAKMQGKSYKEDCTVPRDELRYVHVLHKDFNDDTQEGEIVCNRLIAEDVCEIFMELYESDYQIEKVRLIDEYDADDETSMEDNNSSSFNFRFISHTTKVSKHGRGLAIDINTLYNPYIKVTDEGETIIEPVTAEAYTDRTADFEHKINENDLCYKLFKEHGFEWGGEWQSCKDYQHFEVPDDISDKVNAGEIDADARLSELTADSSASAEESSAAE